MQVVLDPPTPFFYLLRHLILTQLFHKLKVWVKLWRRRHLPWKCQVTEIQNHSKKFLVYVGILATVGVTFKKKKKNISRCFFTDEIIDFGKDT
jgi:hypothetical protein